MDDLTKRLEQHDKEYRKKRHEQWHERYGVGWIRRSLLLLLGDAGESDEGDGGGGGDAPVELYPRHWRWRSCGRVRLRFHHIARFTDDTGVSVVVSSPEPGPRTFKWVSRAYLGDVQRARQRAEERMLLLLD